MALLVANYIVYTTQQFSVAYLLYDSDTRTTTTADIFSQGSNIMTPLVAAEADGVTLRDLTENREIYNTRCIRRPCTEFRKHILEKLELLG